MWKTRLISWVGFAGTVALLASPHIAWVETMGLEAGIPSRGLAPGFNWVGWVFTAASLVAGALVLAINRRPLTTTHAMTRAVLLIVVGVLATWFSVDRILVSVDWVRATNDRFGDIARASMGVGGIVGVLGGIAVIVAGILAVRATRVVGATTAPPTVASPTPDPIS